MTKRKGGEVVAAMTRRARARRFRHSVTALPEADIDHVGQLLQVLDEQINDEWARAVAARDGTPDVAETLALYRAMADDDLRRLRTAFLSDTDHARAELRHAWTAITFGTQRLRLIDQVLTERKTVPRGKRES